MGRPARRRTVTLAAHRTPLVALALGVGADQATKAWARRTLPGRAFVEVVPGLLEWRYGLNRGVGFGLGEGLPDGLRTEVLTGLVLVGIAALVFMYARTRAPSLRLALALLAAGGIGNLIDRVRHGEVTDFIHLRFGDALQVGTFNGADVLILVGFGLLLFARDR